ncbi:E3 ubiquitin-protein ligase SMURF2 [Asbolus verrucosus]|uniref:HECT-type E3 ubiquitin transferase n=1 Tax=Asbolus verrucosus TaxID=1661398 RepID=A0A482VLW5_ASBVE|nr:E3 ubiquitin-protein ligase SMURF2 [Asbolus verrucosus]
MSAQCSKLTKKLFSDQCLDLGKASQEDSEPVKGQIIISLLSRDGPCSGTPLAVVGPQGELRGPPDHDGSATLNEDLPPGWEERRTSNGRLYYVNHVTRSTQWIKPQPTNKNRRRPNDNNNEGGTPEILNNNETLTPSSSTSPVSPVVSPQKEQLRPTPSVPTSPASPQGGNFIQLSPTSTSVVPAPNNISCNASNNNGVANGSDAVSPQRGAGRERRQRSAEERRDGSSRRRSGRNVRNSGGGGPAVQNNQQAQGSAASKLDLPPGYELRTTQQGQVYFFHIPTGVSTWHDPRIPKDLAPLSLALDHLGPLPPGWEMRQTASGRVLRPSFRKTKTITLFRRQIYFVDHNNRTTQFTDPRLNTQILNNILRRASATSNTAKPAPVATTTATPPTTTTTTTTTATAPAVLTNGQAAPQNPAPLSPRTRLGEELPQGLLNDCEHLPKYRRDLVAKLKALRAELTALQPQSGHCRLEVSRSEVFEESYRLIMKMRPKDMRKRLMVKFKGEEGLDYGGVAREWLHLLSREMLNPQYGLFQYSRDDHYTLQINPDSAINPEHLSYFHFVGRVLGIAVFHNHQLEGGFTLPFYKQLLNKPITLQDIEGVDPELHRSLTWML